MLRYIDQSLLLWKEDIFRTVEQEINSMDFNHATTEQFGWMDERSEIAMEPLIFHGSEQSKKGDLFLQSFEPDSELRPFFEPPDPIIDHSWINWEEMIASDQYESSITYSPESPPGPVLPSSDASHIAKRPRGTAPPPFIVIGGASNLIGHEDRSATPPCTMSTSPPVTRGARGALAYDTQQVDARTARRLLGNRASAARSRERRNELVKKAEEALARSAAENAELRAQLEEAVRFIEQLGYSPPKSLSVSRPSPAIAARQR